jgi:hypothetical protein
VRKVNGDKQGALTDTRKALELGVDEAQRKSMVELQKRLEEEC